MRTDLLSEYSLPNTALGKCVHDAAKTYWKVCVFQGWGWGWGVGIDTFMEYSETARDALTLIKGIKIISSQHTPFPPRYIYYIQMGFHESEKLERVR